MALDITLYETNQERLAAINERLKIIDDDYDRRLVQRIIAHHCYVIDRHPVTLEKLDEE